ncbi:MAG: hypothetical protein L3J23_04830 [Flavobacteriaceae bacterium]|nr:hypothetical protein [Flavobacteriaceae bacterium]
MKKLELNQMEIIDGSWNWGNCAVGGMMAGAHLMGFGPLGLIGGLVIGCAVGGVE